MNTITKPTEMTNNKQQTEINAVEYIDKVNQFAKENNTGKPKQQTAVEWLWEIAYNRELTVEDWRQAKEMEKDRMIQLVQGLKDYTHESHTILGHDERDASEFVDIFYEQTYGGGEQ